MASETEPPESTRSLMDLAEMAGPWAMKDDVLRTMMEEVAGLDISSEKVSEMERKAIEARESRPLYQQTGKVAVIPVHGPITKHDSIFSVLFGGTSTLRVRRALRAAQADESVKGIMLHIDSPGGSVAGTGDLADEVARVSSQMPVHAYIEDLGASAAYWVASQANRITASRHAEVGSIGVYATVVDQSGAAEDRGIKVHVVSSGEHKGDFAPGAPVTDKMLANLQERIDSLHRVFVSSVARGRKMSLDSASKLADGRVHLGPQARKLGLVDMVDSYRSALYALARDLGDGRVASVRTGLAATSLAHSVTASVGSGGSGGSSDGFQPTISPSLASYSVSSVYASDVDLDVDLDVGARVPSNPPNGSGNGVPGSWSKPSIGALAKAEGIDKSTWSEFTTSEKNKVAAYHADAADSYTSNSGDDLHLPHHFWQGNSKHKASLNGVRNALARLPQVKNLHSSKGAVQAHLDAHLPSKSESRVWDRYIAGEGTLEWVAEEVGFDVSDLGLAIAERDALVAAGLLEPASDDGEALPQGLYNADDLQPTSTLEGMGTMTPEPANQPDGDPGPDSGPAVDDVTARLDRMEALVESLVGGIEEERKSKLDDRRSQLASEFGLDGDALAAFQTKDQLDAFEASIRAARGNALPSFPPQSALPEEDSQPSAKEQEDARQKWLDEMSSFSAGGMNILTNGRYNS